MDKKELRSEILRRRKSLSSEEVADKSLSIVSNLSKIQCYNYSKIIALYSPYRNEVDLLSLFSDSSKRFCFPKVVKGTKKLDFYLLNNLSDFIEGAYGIMEPSDSLEKVAVEDVELFLVPGVAFSIDMERIGYGGGFYDTTLQYRSTNSKTIGVAFEIQMVDSGFADLWDQTLDGVVTEANIYSKDLI